MAKSIKLPSGYSMPTVGLGTWLATSEEEVETAVGEALKIGIRHFDTAFVYQNEKQIGKVLKTWIESGKIQRKDLFIVTKLPSIGMNPEKVAHFMKKSLEALQLDYVDLYLIHSPIGMQYLNDTEIWPMKDGNLLLDNTTDLEAIWPEMEKLVDAGLAKSIGVSNFEESQLERIQKIARIPISNNQVEVQLYCQQKALREFCKLHNIPICAYGVFGSPGRKESFEKFGLSYEEPDLLSNPLVKSIANAHNVTTAQVLLRFCVQEGMIVIPKSVKPERLRSNFEIYGFELTDEDMENLRALDKGDDGRLFESFRIKGIENHPECPSYVKKKK